MSRFRRQLQQAAVPNQAGLAVRRTAGLAVRRRLAAEYKVILTMEGGRGEL